MSKAIQFKKNGENIYPYPYYPVGSIYISVNSTNPGTVFGGTWEQIKDKFLLACGSKYSNGSTGGAETVTLTTSQIPSHNHSCNTTGGHQHWGTRPRWWYAEAERSGSGSVINANTTHAHDTWQAFGDSAGNHSHTIGNTGGGGSHNNMPPYLAVYVWKRTK